VDVVDDDVLVDDVELLDDVEDDVLAVVELVLVVGSSVVLELDELLDDVVLLDVELLLELVDDVVGSSVVLELDELEVDDVVGSSVVLELEEVLDVEEELELLVLVEELVDEVLLVDVVVGGVMGRFRMFRCARHLALLPGSASSASLQTEPALLSQTVTVPRSTRLSLSMSVHGIVRTPRSLTFTSPLFTSPQPSPSMLR
jgi:hypothetical protein